MRTLLVIFIFGLFSSIAYNQASVSAFETKNVFVKKGDYYYAKKDYKKAIVYYNMAYSSNSGDYYSIIRKAEAYTNMGLYDQAIECYRIVFNSSESVTNKYRLKYALLLLRTKDIQGYEKWIREYNEIVYSDIYDYKTDIEVRAKMYKDSSILLIENESILNSSESEVCPVVYKSNVYFASTRKNLDASKSNGYYNIYSSTYTKDGLLGRLNVFNKEINSTMNESWISFSPSENKLYVTRSSLLQSNLKTYVSSIPTGIKDKVSQTEFTLPGLGSIGHVSVNASGNKMFFVAEGPSGSGGYDIYSSEKTGGKWGDPVNLGAEINSNKDELYPFILGDTLLYFASEGHNSMGGLDLFVVNLKDKDPKPKNLGDKVNSVKDDYGLTFSPGGFTGYFCSNREYGFGEEDIYRLHLIDIKIKYPAFKFKESHFIEDNKINLYLSDGEEYNITSENNAGFDFTFQPNEAYKMVIRHENPIAEEIVSDESLSDNERASKFLNPAPFERTEIDLQPGMKYSFTAGMKPISNQYKQELKEMTEKYQNESNTSTIDLTALAKELQLTEGEVYTIRFIKDNSKEDVESDEPTSLHMNDKTVGVDGRSFFIVLPLDVEANFNILTDIDHFQDNFKPKKVGAVKVDEAPVIPQKIEKEWEGFPILINTEKVEEAGKLVKAKELTIIPGTLYMLTLTKSYPGTDAKLEVFIPLTKGVKYNLGTEAESATEFNNSISQINAGQGADPDAELIDIKVLSKELDISPDDSIVFTLTPAKQFGSQSSAAKSVLTTLDVDGRKYYVTSYQKMQLKLKLEANKKVNIQTDMEYVKENFDPSTIALDIDNTAISTDIVEKEKDIITDPVFDVIVVNFNTGEYAIRPDAQRIIDNKVINVLQADDRLYVTIKGYTDPLGNAEFNKKLSRDRAQAVKDVLLNNGIGENRIRTFSFGETGALQEGQNWEQMSDAELQKHRKVEIVMYLPN